MFLIFLSQFCESVVETCYKANKTNVSPYVYKKGWRQNRSEEKKYEDPI